MKRRALVVTLCFSLIALALIGVSRLAAPARADDANAPALVFAPQAGANTAEWTIEQMDFESRYPNGFAFVLRATSSGGEIVSARVEWVHRPNTRTKQPISVRRATGEIDPTTGLITAVWEPTQSTAVPPWVGVYYRWRLRDAAGNEFVTDENFAEYADTSRRWQRTETDEVIVFANGLSDEMGDLVAAAMDAQRQKYLAGWGQALPYRPRVILFGDMDTWLEWQVGHQDTSGLGLVRVGVTSDEWGGTVQVLYGTEEELAYGTVLHEVEHLYQREFLAGRIAFTPDWFIEGDASFYQLDDVHQVATDYVADLVRRGDLPVLLQGDGPVTFGRNALHGYYMGYKFFEYLDRRWGIAIHRQIMDLLAQNMPFTEAIETATGQSVLELERAWREWLGAPGVVPTLIPTWTPLPFLASPTPMQFGSGK